MSLVLIVGMLPVFSYSRNTASVLVLALWTSGWSNGFRPKIDPAMAVANSHRKNSPPISYLSRNSSCTVGIPIAWSSLNSRSDFSSLLLFRWRCTIKWSSDSFVENTGFMSSVNGTIPFPFLPRLSAISCSIQSLKPSMAEEVISVSFEFFLRARVPIMAPRIRPGFS